MRIKQAQTREFKLLVVVLFLTFTVLGLVFVFYPKPCDVWATKFIIQEKIKNGMDPELARKTGRSDMGWLGESFCSCLGIKTWTETYYGEDSQCFGLIYDDRTVL